MTFGNEETFSLIERILLRSEENAYDPLCVILYEDVGILINKYCQDVRYHDREDLKQEVVSKVIIYLPRFYNDSAQKTEAERNSWLKSVVINARNDYFRKMTRYLEKNALEYEDSFGQVDETSIEKKIELRETLFETLSLAFSIRTSPEKLMAFVYNNLLGRLTRTNGSPLNIYETFKGCTLRVMAKKMVFDLSEALQCEIPSWVIKPLQDKVDLRPEDYFDLSPRGITDSSNWIAKKIKEHQRDG